MADTPDTVQNLGVKITEDRASTAAVVSSLERVEKKVADLQKTAAADRASMAESAAANRTLATSVEGLAGSLEKKFAATDKVLSVLGKATGAIGLATGAVALATAAYKALVPEVDLLNGRLAEQERRAKATEAAMKSLATVQGSVRFIDPDDLLTVARAEKDLTDAQAQRLLLATQQAEAQAELEASGRRLAEVNARVGTSEEDKARALQGFVDRAATLNARMQAFRDAQVQAAGREADAETRLIQVREEAQRKAAAPLATVPFEPPAGADGGGGGGGGRGGGRRTDAPNSGRQTGQIGIDLETLTRTLGPDQMETQVRAVEALGAASQSTFAAMAAAAAEAMAPVDAFFGGLQESATAALIDVVIFGESAEQMANGLAKAFARQALAQVPIEIGRWHAATGLALLGHPTAAAAAVAHLDAALVFGAAGAGALGVAAMTGGIRGGGGGGGGGGQAPGAGAGGLGRRMPDEGGGSNITVNVDYRGASIETGDDIARSVMGFVRRGASMLGGPGLPADDGRNRRRPR